MRRNLPAALPIVLLCGTAFGQSPSTRPVFEVASVKRNTTDGPSDLSRPRRSGDLVIMHNTQPYSMIFYAYNLRAGYQMVGYKRLPDDWNWFDVEARAGSSASDDQVRLMFQSLLEERFQLKVHREMREMPEYKLTVAKAKAKLQPPVDGPMKLTIEGKSFEQRVGTCGTSLWLEGTHIVCHAVEMPVIIREFSSLLKAPVADNTGLTGRYDVHLHYVPEDRQLQPDAPPGPTLIQAIQEELGLRIVKDKGKVEVLVIDSLEKPSEN